MKCLNQQANILGRAPAAFGGFRRPPAASTGAAHRIPRRLQQQPGGPLQGMVNTQRRGHRLVLCTKLVQTYGQRRSKALSASTCRMSTATDQQIN